MNAKYGRICDNLEKLLSVENPDGSQAVENVGAMLGFMDSYVSEALVRRSDVHILKSLSISEEEEEKEPYRPPETSLQCMKCKTSFGDEEQHQIVFVEECCHVLCKPCLKAAIEASYPDV